jgi:hypothetical protein
MNFLLFLLRKVFVLARRVIPGRAHVRVLTPQARVVIVSARPRLMVHSPREVL